MRRILYFEHFRILTLLVYDFSLVIGLDWAYIIDFDRELDGFEKTNFGLWQKVVVLFYSDQTLVGTQSCAFQVEN